MSKKILIVEDNKDLHEMFRIKFEKWGFEVFVAEDWFSALWLAVEKKPDLILLDIMMPDMDWFETLKVIREQTSLNTKVVIFSNIKNAAHIDKAKKLWADDYLVKADHTPNEVYNKVNKILWIELEQTMCSSSANKTIKCPHCDKDLDVEINLK